MIKSPDDNLEINHWLKSLKRADDLLGHRTPMERERLLRRSQLIIDNVGTKVDHRRKKTLELGCGTGAYTEIFAKEKWHLTATDLVPELAEATKKRAAKNKGSRSLKIAVADAKKLRFADKSFDTVIGNSVLHHIIPVEQGLKEIFRVLKPGGKIAFTEPNMLNPHIFLQKNIPFLKELSGDSPTETAFVRWKLARQLRERGFVNVKVVPFDFLYPFLPVSLISLIRPIGLMAERIPLLREFAGSVLISAEKPRDKVS